MHEDVAHIDGRFYRVLVHDEDTDPTRGLIIGPPAYYGDLNLPPEIEERLHMELFVRGLTDKKTALKRRQEVYAALMAALSLTVDKVLESY